MKKFDWSSLKSYLDDGMGVREISRLAGASHTAVRQAIIRLGLETPRKGSSIKRTLSQKTKEQWEEHNKKLSVSKSKNSKFHGERVELVCTNCNKKFTRMKNWVARDVAFGNKIKNRYCSRGCQWAHCLVIRWERDRKEYNTVAQRKMLCALVNRWTRAVKKRDEFRCVECGHQGKKNDGSLDAHHILDWCNNPEERLEIENGITLCKSCHKKKHEKLPKYSTWGIDSTTSNYTNISEDVSMVVLY